NVIVDFGLYSPTTYMADENSPAYVDFSTGTLLPSTNNIFVNGTLYGTYSQFMLETVMPLLSLPLPSGDIAPLDNENRLVLSEVAFAKSYFCNVRQLKSPLVALVSILVGEYAFIHGGYWLFIFMATWYQKRRVLNGTKSI